MLTMPLNVMLVNIDITDAKDMFFKLNYIVHVQEEKVFGHIVAKFSIVDADEAPKFLMKMKTWPSEWSQMAPYPPAIGKFNHQAKDNYILQIRVFDNAMVCSSHGMLVHYSSAVHSGTKDLKFSDLLCKF